MARLAARRHIGFYAAVIAGLLAAAVMAFFAGDLALVTGVNCFFVAYLGLAAFQLRRMSAAYLRAHVSSDNVPAPLILVAMFIAVAVSTTSLVLAMLGDASKPLHLVLAIISVVLGWFAIHTMWAMHYAYDYYRPPATRHDKGDVAAGLEFPGHSQPDGTAFLYFSYVIGMTAQVSDTTVTSNSMRRLVIVQSVFSFFFNTVIVAAAVNIVVSLAR